MKWERRRALGNTELWWRAPATGYWLRPVWHRSQLEWQRTSPYYRDTTFLGWGLQYRERWRISW